MVHLKNIIKGILAGAVFFMAVQVSVAQEKVVAADDVELNESIEAKILATTVQKVNSEFAKKQEETNVEKIQVMKVPKDPMLKSTPSYHGVKKLDVPITGIDATGGDEKVVQTTVWFPARAAGETDPSLANFDTEAGSLSQDALCNQGNTFYCAIGFPEDECIETSTGVYELDANHTSSGTLAKYNP